MGKSVLMFDEKDVNSVSRTKQSFAKECDVNNIIKKANKTGFLVDPLLVSNRNAIFGDFSAIDFRSMLERINSVNTEFLKLPSDIRAKFQNDPSLLLEFMSKEENKAECVKLGLLPEETIVTPQPEVVSNPNPQA